MSVLIKGMEMPKCCGDCPYRKKINPEENKCFLNGKIFDDTFSILFERRHADCPLVPIPPHGRLVDADAFIAEQRRLYCEHCKRRFGMWKGKMQYIYDIGDAPCRSCGYGDVLDDLENAPTVIEAEESE